MEVVTGSGREGGRAGGPGPQLPGRAVIRRDADRRITAAGLVASACFLTASIAAALLPDGARRGLWLSLHLALPGAATVAIGAVLPFFVAALAAAPPGRPALRIATLVALGGGAAGVSMGLPAGALPLAVGSGLLFVAGLAALGLLLVTILGGSLGYRRGLLPRAYAWAIVEVVVGASLATSYLAGWSPVVAAWGRLKPVHAWLNVFGFVALVIAATLIHLLPTVLGARIGLRRSVRVALVGLAAGPAAIAAGYAFGLDPLARGGALIVLAGALGLVRFATAADAGRFAWTTDHAWHRFATRSLLAGVGWFVVGVGIAAARVLVFGAEPIAWGIELVGPALVAGFVLQVLVASWTHLVPAVGPGGILVHAAQRVILARGGDARLLTLNLGAALLAVGIAGGLPPVATLGAIAVGAALLSAIALVARAMLVRGDPAA